MTNDHTLVSHRYLAAKGGEFAEQKMTSHGNLITVIVTIINITIALTFIIFAHFFSKSMIIIIIKSPSSICTVPHHHWTDCGEFQYHHCLHHIHHHLCQESIYTVVPDHHLTKCGEFADAEWSETVIVWILQSSSSSSLLSSTSSSLASSEPSSLSSPTSLTKPSSSPPPP